jgi:hypothetical protein
MKTCTRCNITKPLTEFRHALDDRVAATAGRRPISKCFICEREMAKVRMRKHKSRIRTNVYTGDSRTKHRVPDEDVVAVGKLLAWPVLR